MCVFLSASASRCDGQSSLEQPNWLTVSDPDELQRTWQNALVALPAHLGGDIGQFLNPPATLRRRVDTVSGGEQLPVVLYLHSCEGLGHHREDLRRLAQLGFVVIAPDSHARLEPRQGCHEEEEKFLPTFDLATAYRKAELAFALRQLEEMAWTDRTRFYLIGSGLSGMVAAHHRGADFAGIVIEGWGCRGPNPIFDGIWAPAGVRVLSVVSRNDPWFAKNPGFGVDCESFINARDKSRNHAVVLERPAHYVSWYPAARPALIRFLMRGFDVDVEELVQDVPDIISRDADSIVLRERWSDEAVYDAARRHCADNNKRSYLSAEPRDRVFSFICQ